MNEIKIFSNENFGEIRTAVTESGDPLFCLSDLCKSLNLSNASRVASRIDEDDKTNLELGLAGGAPTFVTESGMYTVILRSDSPLAKPMQKWVTSEVLPSIRKSGGYIASKPEDTPEIIMARALILAQDTIARSKQELRNTKEQLAIQERVIEEQEPRVLFSKAVETSRKSILIAELAKLLTQNGVKIGQNRLFDWLRDHGYLGNRGNYYNKPSQNAMEMGLFELKKVTICHSDGSVRVETTPKVTGKGQVYFINKFLKLLQPVQS